MTCLIFSAILACPTNCCKSTIDDSVLWEGLVDELPISPSSGAPSEPMWTRRHRSSLLREGEQLIELTRNIFIMASFRALQPLGAVLQRCSLYAEVKLDLRLRAGGTDTAPTVLLQLIVEHIEAEGRWAPYPGSTAQIPLIIPQDQHFLSCQFSRRIFPGFRHHPLNLLCSIHSL